MPIEEIRGSMGYGASNLIGECFSQAAADLGGGSPSPRHEGL